MTLATERRRRQLAQLATEKVVAYLIRTLKPWQYPREETVMGDQETAEDVDLVNLGGLQRCCLATLSTLYPDGAAKVAAQGQTLQCRYIDNPNHRMIFEDGVWRWNDPLEQKDEPEAKEPEDDATREHMRRWADGEKTHDGEEKDEDDLCAV